MEYNTTNLHKVNDYIINKIVEDPTSFGESIYNRAQEIYNERGLSSEEKQRQISIYPELKDKVKLSLKNGSSMEKEVAFLVNSGMNHDHAKDLISQINIKVQQKFEEEESEVSWGKFMMYGFIGLFIMKLFLRLIWN